MSESFQEDGSLFHRAQYDENKRMHGPQTALYDEDKSKSTYWTIYAWHGEQVSELTYTFKEQVNSITKTVAQTFRNLISAKRKGTRPS